MRREDGRPPTSGGAEGARLAEMRRRRREILGERSAQQRADLLYDNRQQSGE